MIFLTTVQIETWEKVVYVSTISDNLPLPPNTKNVLQCVLKLGLFEKQVNDINSEENLLIFPEKCDCDQNAVWEYRRIWSSWSSLKLIVMENCGAPPGAPPASDCHRWFTTLTRFSVYLARHVNVSKHFLVWHRTRSDRGPTWMTVTSILHLKSPLKDLRTFLRAILQPTTAVPMRILFTVCLKITH